MSSEASTSGVYDEIARDGDNPQHPATTSPSTEERFSKMTSPAESDLSKTDALAQDPNDCACRVSYSHRNLQNAKKHLSVFLINIVVAWFNRKTTNEVQELVRRYTANATETIEVVDQARWFKISRKQVMRLFFELQGDANARLYAEHENLSRTLLKGALLVETQKTETRRAVEESFAEREKALSRAFAGDQCSWTAGGTIVGTPTRRTIQLWNANGNATQWFDLLADVVGGDVGQRKICPHNIVDPRDNCSSHVFRTFMAKDNKTLFAALEMLRFGGEGDIIACTKYVAAVNTHTGDVDVIWADDDRAVTIGVEYLDPSGQLLVGDTNGKITVLDTANGSVLQTLRVSSGLVSFSVANETLAAAYPSGRIVLWRRHVGGLDFVRQFDTDVTCKTVEKDGLIFTTSGGSGVTCPIFSRDGTTIAALRYTGEDLSGPTHCCAWSTLDGRLLWETPLTKTPVDTVWGCLTQDSDVAIIPIDGALQIVFFAANGDIVDEATRVFPDMEDITAASFSPDGRRIACLYRGGRLCVYDF